MKATFILLFLALPANADFNGEIVTPTFVFTFRCPTFGAPNKDHETGATWHRNPVDPGPNWPFAPFGHAAFVAGNAPPAVVNFLKNSVFIGDSITHSWDLQAYFGIPITNKGIGGQRTDQMLARFDHDVLSLNPRGVFILGGINDAAQGYSVAFAEKNISLMVQRADAAASHPLVFVGTLIPATPANNTIPNLPLFVNAFNSWLKGYCTGTNCTAIDYNKAAGGPGFSFFYHQDYVHPNNNAYVRMSRMLLHVVGRRLGGYGRAGGHAVCRIGGVARSLPHQHHCSHHKH